MHTVQKSPPNLGHVYAHHAKVCPKSEARLCTPCKIFPQIWGTFMHPVQNLPLNLRHIFAPHAKSSPNSEAQFCTPCKIFPQNSGTFLHPMHKRPPVFRLVFEVLGRFFTDIGHGFQVMGWPVSNLKHVILIF